jgi:O-antigen/teichoic acid export membrane protein
VDDAGLNARVARGFSWKFASEATLQSSKIVVAVVLARLLSPHDYGLAGMVIVFTTIAPIFSDLALGAALIHKPEPTEDDRSTVFWTSVATGALLTGICIAISGPLASFYGQPAVQPLFIAFSFTFLLGSLGATQYALLTKEMNFRGLETRVIASTAFGAAVGILLALEGAGAWAIIGQQLTVSVVSTVLLWKFSTWHPRRRFSRRSLRELGGYSGNVFSAHFVIQIGPSVNNLMIGRWAGTTALGVYSVGQNAVLLPFYRIAAPIQEVLFPAFAHLQHEPKRIAEMWLRANRVVAAIAFPCLLGLAVSAPEFVHVVLGAKWKSATVVIQILCWVGILQALQRLNVSILQARAYTRELLWFSFLSFGGGVVGVAAGLHWGVVGVAVAYAIAASVTLPAYTYVTARSVHTPLRDCVTNVSGVAQAAAVMGGVMIAFRHILLGGGVGPTARLLLLVAVGGIVFFAMAGWRAPELRDEVAGLRRRLRPPISDAGSAAPPATSAG